MDSELYCARLSLVALPVLLAKQVLQQNQALHWNLLENPNRLAIQTIDSLATTLFNVILQLHFFKYATSMIVNAFSFNFHVSCDFITGFTSQNFPDNANLMVRQYSKWVFMSAIIDMF